jgi:hypothetical protein
MRESFAARLCTWRVAKTAGREALHRTAARQQRHCLDTAAVRAAETVMRGLQTTGGIRSSASPARRSGGRATAYAALWPGIDCMEQLMPMDLLQAAAKLAFAAETLPKKIPEMLERAAQIIEDEAKRSKKFHTLLVKE